MWYIRVSFTAQLVISYSRHSPTTISGWVNFAQAGRLRCFGRACSGLLLYHPSSCFDQKEVMKCDNSQTITAKSGFTQSKSLGNKYYTTFRNWSLLDIIAICSRNSHNIHIICTCSSFVGVSKQWTWCFFVALSTCKLWTKKPATFQRVSLPWIPWYLLIPGSNWWDLWCCPARQIARKEGRCFWWLENTTLKTHCLQMGVSKNRGTPKWMVYNGNPY